MIGESEAVPLFFFLLSIGVYDIDFQFSKSLKESSEEVKSRKSSREGARGGEVVLHSLAAKLFIVLQQCADFLFIEADALAQLLKGVKPLFISGEADKFHP